MSSTDSPNCPDCGSALTTSTNKDGQTFLVCMAKCGYVLTIDARSYEAVQFGELEEWDEP